MQLRLYCSYVVCLLHFSSRWCSATACISALSYYFFFSPSLLLFILAALAWLCISSFIFCLFHFPSPCFFGPVLLPVVFPALSSDCYFSHSMQLLVALYSVFSSDIFSTIFFAFSAKTCHLEHFFFPSSNWAIYSYTKLFCCFEVFLEKLTKNCHLCQKKCFSHQIEPHTAKLSFSVVLKHFYRNWQKKLVI